MEVARTLEAIRAWRRDGEEDDDGDVGFVPTMGYLHEGHLALVRRARVENARVAASIFVNPAQFDDASDLDAYPRDLDRDLRLLEEAGTDVVFLPTPEIMYPPGFDTWVDPGTVAAPNEGRHRPGHFRGVATVVLKLFHLVEPHRAYFGRKDAQQLALVQTMVRDLDLGLEVVPCDTVRDDDGLAMSSRNARLDGEDRRAAPVLHRALAAARDAAAAGERDADVLRRLVEERVGEEPRGRLEYVSVADPTTFEEMDRLDGPAVLSLAVHFGDVRLIDNVLVTAD